MHGTWKGGPHGGVSIVLIEPFRDYKEMSLERQRMIRNRQTVASTEDSCAADE